MDAHTQAQGHRIRGGSGAESLHGMLRWEACSTWVQGAEPVDQARRLPYGLPSGSPSHGQARGSLGEWVPVNRWKASRGRCACAPVAAAAGWHTELLHQQA